MDRNEWSGLPISIFSPTGAVNNINIHQRPTDYNVNINIWIYQYLYCQYQYPPMGVVKIDPAKQECVEE